MPKSEADDYLNKDNPQAISEAYHKAKEDGSNPELVKAVEKLLGNPTEQQKTETTPNVEDWSKDVESTAKALDSANGKELELLALKQSIKQLPDKDFEDAEANKKQPSKNVGVQTQEELVETPAKEAVKAQENVSLTDNGDGDRKGSA